MMSLVGVGKKDDMGDGELDYLMGMLNSMLTVFLSSLFCRISPPDRSQRQLQEHVVVFVNQPQNTKPDFTATPISAHLTSSPPSSPGRQSPPGVVQPSDINQLSPHVLAESGWWRWRRRRQVRSLVPFVGRRSRWRHRRQQQRPRSLLFGVITTFCPAVPAQPLDLHGGFDDEHDAPFRQQLQPAQQRWWRRRRWWRIRSWIVPLWSDQVRVESVGFVDANLVRDSKRLR